MNSAVDVLLHSPSAAGAQPAGTWRRSGDNVVVKCRCGMLAQLQHSISDDGLVSPSVQCPACSYHAWVQLREWKEHGLRG